MENFEIEYFDTDKNDENTSELVKVNLFAEKNLSVSANYLWQNKVCFQAYNKEWYFHGSYASYTEEPAREENMLNSASVSGERYGYNDYLFIPRIVNAEKVRYFIFAAK